MTFSNAELKRKVALTDPFEGRSLGSLARGELLELQRVIGRTRKSLDALAVQVAGEVGRLSTPDAGLDGLARRQGFSTPQQLVAQDLGTTPGEAGRMIELGAALQGAPVGDDAGGEDDAGGGPGGSGPRWPVVAQQMREGSLGMQAAAVITQVLEQWASLEAPSTPVGEMERRLVSKAQSLPLPRLRSECQRLLALAQPQELVERERRQHQARDVRMSEDVEGMMMLSARLDPASGVWVRAWLDAQVKHAFQQRREHTGDDRTAGQIRADALVMLARHGLDCDRPTSGVKTTVVVRIDQEDLERGLGVGECDATSMPLSASAVRTMAVDAEILPMVMGGKSLPLDVGRTQRLFSAAQRMALVERDGGCAWCHAPPSYCEAHHIRWWERDAGRTDLDNGVMLCTGCHHRVHRDNWGIRVRDGDVWFTPPASIDPARRPRIGGKAHLALTG